MGYGTVNVGYPIKKGVPGSVATLDENGKVPAAQIPGTLTEHVANGDIHVTAEEKAAWDAKVDSEDVTTALNRTTAVNAADTNYTAYMARGVSLNAADTTPTANGTIAWTYK